jgi:hypothetical protein
MTKAIIPKKWYWPMAVTIPLLALAAAVGLCTPERGYRSAAGTIAPGGAFPDLPSDLTITATSPGLRPATVTLKTLPVPPGVDMPKDLPVKQPTHWTPASTTQAAR